MWASCKQCYIFKKVDHASKVCKECRERKAFDKTSEVFMYSAADLDFEKVAESIDGFFKTYKQDIVADESKDHKAIAMNIEKFMRSLAQNQSYNVEIELGATFNKTGNESFKKTIYKTKDKRYVYMRNKEISKIVDDLIKYIKEMLEFLATKDEESGLTIVSIDTVYLHVYPNVLNSTIIKNQALNSEAKVVGKGYTKLPQMFEASRSLVNIKNTDSKCFFWALMAHFLKDEKINTLVDAEPAKKLDAYKNINVKPQTPQYYMQFKMFNYYKDLIKIKKYPVSIDDISMIERENKLNIRVFGLFENKLKDDFTSFVVSKLYQNNRKNNKTINMLLYKEHYIYIKDLAKFLGLFKNNACKTFVCESCGTSIFTRADALKKHYERCKDDVNAQKYKLPTDDYVEFKEYEKLNEVPFRMYADFESYFDTAFNDAATNVVKDTESVKYIKQHKMMAWVLNFLKCYSTKALALALFYNMYC